MCTRSSSSGALALVALVLAACPRAKEDAEEYAAKNAVVRYNQGLVEAYRASRADLLAQVAGEAEISKVAALISGLATRGQFMEARQLGFEVGSVELVRGADGGLSGARVEAEERWSYEHRALTARDTPVAAKVATYRLTYLLERREGGWIVGQVLDRDHPLAGPTP